MPGTSPAKGAKAEGVMWEVDATQLSSQKKRWDLHDEEARRHGSGDA